MVDVAGPKPQRRWSLGLVALAAAAVALVAWAVREAVESANIPYDTGRQWPAFWATALGGLAVVLVLANRPRATPRRALATTATAGGAFAAALVLVVFVGLTTAHCGMTPESASWNDKLLHELLRGGPDHRGNPVTVTAPLEGFAFRDADLDARWVRYSLVHVAWGRGTGPDFGPTALTAEPGIVRAAYLDLADLRGHRDEVVGFLQGFGASPEEADRIAVAMESNVTDPAEAATRWSYPQFSEFTAAIPAEWGPQAAWDSFCCIAQAPLGEAGSLGFADLRVGNWLFAFSLETKRLDGDGFTLRSDAEGRAEFEGFVGSDLSEGEYKGHVQRTLKGLGLPEPERAAMSVGGSVC